jgi:chemotaxis response regulator CheB
MHDRSHSDSRSILEKAKGLAQLSSHLMEASRQAIEQSAVRIADSKELLAPGRSRSAQIRRDIVVIGGSAGSFEPLEHVVRMLPVNCRASVFIVQHSTRDYWNLNGPIGALADWTSLSATFAQQGKRFQPGHVYLCPSDHHLVLANDVMRLEQSPKENLMRPSIDVLFRSAAAVFGRRVIGVLLSGVLRDGVAGLWQIKRHGGLTLVQDPKDAQFPGMPTEAIASTDVDYVLPGRNLASKLREVLMERHRQPAAAKQVRVMIVEDEGPVARNLSNQLQYMGYRVTAAVRTGEEAFGHAAETQPEIILMDVRLAGAITGIEAARRIWETLQIPIVFVTGDADEATLNEIKSTENYGCVMKPLQARAVHAAIELALDRREKQQRHSNC